MSKCSNSEGRAATCTTSNGQQAGMAVKAEKLMAATRGLPTLKIMYQDPKSKPSPTIGPGAVPGIEQEGFARSFN